MNELRPYQAAAKAAADNHLRTRTGNPLVVIPAGGGTTPIIASLCQDAVAKLGERVLILAPSNRAGLFVARKLHGFCPQLPDGILLWEQPRITRTSRVVVGSIGLVGTLASKLGAFDVVVLAKAHLIAPGCDEAYQQFLAAARAENPDLRVVGFASMPHRLKITRVCKAEPICSADGFLNHICFEAGTAELIANGYLARPITREALTTLDTTALPVEGLDIVGSGAEAQMDHEFVEAVCAELVDRTKERRAVLIFARGIVPSAWIVEVLMKKHEIPKECVQSLMTCWPAKLLTQLQQGRLKYLVAENLLPAELCSSQFDCVIPLWPTLSLGFYSYMVSEGLRPNPQKKDCLILDFVGNAIRHGPVDQIASGAQGPQTGVIQLARACSNCRLVVAGDCGTCPECANSLPPPDRWRRVVIRPSSDVPTVGATCAKFEVHEIKYSVHTKASAKAGEPKTMRVDYRLDDGRWQSEFICLEHTGIAHQKAVQWWIPRSTEHVPSTAERAVAIAQAGGIARTERITVTRAAGERYDRIVGYELIVRCESC
jgi:DNA repair protein RadD